MHISGHVSASLKMTTTLMQDLQKVSTILERKAVLHKENKKEIFLSLDEHVIPTVQTLMKGLLSDIENRSLHMAVLGSGYVGLPAAALFADTGFQVVAVDIKPEVVRAVNNGLSPVGEPGLHELVSRNVQAGRLKATLDSTEILTQADAVVVSVQTPVDENRNPNLSFLTKATEEVGENMKKGTVVVLSSTVPPGTTLREVRPRLESLSGFRADVNFYLAYVPERIAPGNAVREFVESPRLVGGAGPDSTKITAELFRKVCKRVVETDVATAEVSKLAENAFRDVNIAFANQLALICEQHGVDVEKVIESANTHPRVNIHRPGPGVGGPCLTKDPYLLIDKIELGEQNIIETARHINDSMPKHVVLLTLKALENMGKRVENSRIAILGTAYKANTDDSRSSPSKPVIQKLLRSGADVVVYDPYCDETFGAEKAGSLNEAVKGSDCFATITDHADFKDLNLKEIRALMEKEPVIVDAARTVDVCRARNLSFIYYGLGYAKAK